MGSTIKSSAGRAVRKFAWRALGYRRYTEAEFRLKHHYPLNLDAPKTFSEKIQWTKVIGHPERWGPYVDKYTVRDFVAESVGTRYLVPLLGVYDDPEDIDVAMLPGSFVLKATHGSGWNFIVPDKAKVDWPVVQVKLRQWVRSNYYDVSGEANYRDLRGRIILETFLKDGSGDLRDYKFFCFNGEPRYVQVDAQRFTDHRRDIYTTRWEKMPLKIAHDNLPIPVARPTTLDEMLLVCRRLSAGFPFVRVDLYSCDEKVYFGELTFTPGGGMERFEPFSYDLEFGSHLDLNSDFGTFTALT